MVSRRALLALLPAAALAAPAIAQTARKIRIGFQKGEPSLSVAKQNRSLETALAPLGVQVEWIEFEFGPPMMEAMRSGGIDFGTVGDAPPIFAQAARADLLYLAAVPAGAAAILVPPNSPLKGLQDLKGKKLAFARASSGHNLAIAAVEKSGLAWGDITPVQLNPSEAGAAFLRGDVDAWSIWDPFFAMFETRPGVRVLANAADILPRNAFYMSRRPFVAANEDIIAATVDAMTIAEQWAASHRPEVAKMLSDATGIPLEPQLRATGRDPLKVVPMDDSFAESQQRVADRFHALGVIPTALDIRKQVWRREA